MREIAPFGDILMAFWADLLPLPRFQVRFCANIHHSFFAENSHFCAVNWRKCVSFRSKARLALASLAQGDYLAIEVYSCGRLSARPCVARGPLAVQGLHTCARSFSPLPSPAPLSACRLARVAKLPRLLRKPLPLLNRLLRKPLPLLTRLLLLLPALTRLLRLLPALLRTLLRLLPASNLLPSGKGSDWARKGYPLRAFSLSEAQGGWKWGMNAAVPSRRRVTFNPAGLASAHAPHGFCYRIVHASRGGSAGPQLDGAVDQATRLLPAWFANAKALARMFGKPHSEIGIAIPSAIRSA